MSDLCANCGHARAFHRIGTGDGVPVGRPYCDDRHRPENEPSCSCRGFLPSVGYTKEHSPVKKCCVPHDDHVLIYDVLTAACTVMRVLWALTPEQRALVLETVQAQLALNEHIKTQPEVHKG